MALFLFSNGFELLLASLHLCNLLGQRLHSVLFRELVRFFYHLKLLLMLRDDCLQRDNLSYLIR